MTDAILHPMNDSLSILTPISPRATAKASARSTPFLLMTPLMVMLTAFTVLPGLMTVTLAFFNVDILSGTYRFVGLANFESAAERGEVFNSIKVTFLYVALTVPSSLFFGLLVALALDALERGRAFWRAIYFLPVAATLVAMSIVWRWMFLARRGVIDVVVGPFFGIGDWLNSPLLALPAVALVGNWQQIGFVAIIYLAAVAAVPQHVLDAARIDGAGPWSRFWHVTWPALGPTTVFAAVVSTTHGLSIFDTVATMTAGGPSQSTQTLAYLMWQRGIYFFDIGGGAVVAVVLLVLALLAAAIQMRSAAKLEAAGRR